VDPNRTTYVSRHLTPGWLPSVPGYEVQTYSHGYGGSMNLVKATLTSDNTVYAQLDADLGPESVAKTARDMGITSPLHGYPAEGLGGLTDGVSPLEMARAYATIANGGYRMRPIVVRKVTFPDKHVDNLGKPSRHKVFEDGVAYEATKILVKNVQGGTGTAAQIGCPVAGKTGTVDNYTDAWFVGYTPRLVTSVWVGHPKDPYPLGPGAAGGVVAAPIWGRYMKSAHGKFCGDFPKPKVPFAPQPFFGKYSRTGAKESKPDQRPGAAQPGIAPDGQGTGKDGGGTKYPPDAYEAPPQGAPTTTQPPAATPPAANPPPAQDGGTGAPAPNP
jgi:penicillin-binding protein 1A